MASGLGRQVFHYSQQSYVPQSVFGGESEGETAELLAVIDNDISQAIQVYLSLPPSPYLRLMSDQSTKEEIASGSIETLIGSEMLSRDSNSLW